MICDGCTGGRSVAESHSTVYTRSRLGAGGNKRVEPFLCRCARLRRVDQLQEAYGGAVCGCKRRRIKVESTCSR